MFSVELSIGDNDPQAININDLVGYALLSFDLGTPDEATDRRTMKFEIAVRGLNAATINRGVAALSAWLDLAQERDGGRLEAATVRFADPGINTCWADVVEGELETDINLSQAMAGVVPTVHLTVTARALLRGAATTLLENYTLWPNDPPLVLEAVDSDAPSLLLLDADDLSREGTGVAQLLASAMALPRSAEVPENILRLTTPDTQALTSTALTLSQGAAVFDGTTSRTQTDAGVLDETQAWIALRVTPVTLGQPLFVWGDNGSNLIYCYLDGGGGLVGGRVSGGNFAEVANPGGSGIVVGVPVVVLLEWTAAQLTMTIGNQAPFVVGSGPVIPTLASTTLYLGYDAAIFGGSAAFFHGTMDWAMTGLGTLTAPDRAYLTGRDATDPYPGDLTRQSRPSLVWTADRTTQANRPNNQHLTLDGYTPSRQRVGENWTRVASGTLAWTVPQARASSLIGRLADAGIIGSPIDDLTATVSNGPLDVVQRVRSSIGASILLSNTGAGNTLVAYARAYAGNATFTWPGGWTVQARADNDRWHAEVATMTAAGGNLTVTVTTGGSQATAAGVEILGASGLVGTLSLTAQGSNVSASLPGGAAYQATVLFFDANDYALGGLAAWSDGHARDNAWSPRLLTAHPITTISTPIETIVSTLAPGTLNWNPGIVTYTVKVVDVIGDDGQPTGETKEELVSHFRPANGGILFGLTFSSAASAPTLSAGEYEVGVTALMNDGSESPLELTETVRTAGLRAINVVWSARDEILAGLVQWRIYKVKKGGSWHFETAEPEDNMLTITSETSGTTANPPLVTELSGIETYAVVRSAPDAIPAYTLPSASLQVGNGKYERVDLGMVPSPLAPNGPAQVFIEVWARTSQGYRTLLLDQLRLFPIFQERGSLSARLLGREPSVPLRWTAYADNVGRASYRLQGLLGDVDVVNGVSYRPVGQQDSNDPTWTIPRVRTWDTTQNLDPTRSFGSPAPMWMPVRKGTTFVGLTLQTKDVGSDAYAGGLDSWVLEYLRANSSTIEQAQGPVMPVTAGTLYHFSGYIRTALGQTAVSVRFDIAWYNAAGTLLSTTSGTAVTTTASWTIYELNGTAPAGTTAARLLWVWPTATQTGGGWLDAVQFEPGPVRTPFLYGDPSVNLFANASVEPTVQGWWQTSTFSGTAPALMNHSTSGPVDGIYTAQSNAGNLNISTDPIRIIGGKSYAFSLPLAWSGGTINILSLNGSVQWMTSSWAALSPVALSAGGGGTPGSYTSTGTLTAPVTAVAAVITANAVPASGSTPSLIADAWTAVEGSSIPSSYLPPTDEVVRPRSGVYTVIHKPALNFLTAATGRWLARVKAWLDNGTLIDWWADSNNYLRLDLTASTIRLTRTTGGVSQTATVARPSDRSLEYFVQADWSTTRLRVALFNAGWTVGAEVSSTSWPDLTSADWVLGQAADGTATLNGSLAWVAQDLNSEADAAPYVYLEEPQPFDWDTGLGWLWTANTPLRVIMWNEGGFASVTGGLHGGATPTALSLIPLAAGQEWHRAPLRVTVANQARQRFFQGAG